MCISVLACVSYLFFFTLKTKEDKGESSLDLAPCAATCHIPGKVSEYILVGRNLQQWRDSLEYVSLFGEEVEPVVTSGGGAGTAGADRSAGKTKTKSEFCVLQEKL